MNIKDLEINKKYKNYKIVCETINAQIKKGKSKQLQLKDWERYFTYHKEGIAFIIDEVFDRPRAKEDNRSKGNKSIYIPYIESLLIDYLVTHEGKCQITLCRLFQELGMVNQRYNDKMYRDNLSNINPDFTNWQIHQFYIISLQRIRKIITTALNNLQKREIIKYDMVYMIVDKNGEAHTADKSETKDILVVQNDVLKEFGFPNILSLHYRGKIQVFYSRVNQLLDELYGYKSTFKVFDIVLCQARNDNYVSLDRPEKTTSKLDLNNLVVDAINETMECTYNTNEKKWSEAKKQTKQFYMDNDLYLGDDFFDITDRDIRIITKAFKYPEDFLRVQRDLIEQLVRIVE